MINYNCVAGVDDYNYVAGVEVNYNYVAGVDD